MKLKIKRVYERPDEADGTRMLNVFVDKASGVVIHWESQPEPR
jgi:uncharacterized protein YeaO (DUF488 family)